MKSEHFSQSHNAFLDHVSPHSTSTFAMIVAFCWVLHWFLLFHLYICSVMLKFKYKIEYICKDVCLNCSACWERKSPEIFPGIMNKTPCITFWVNIAGPMHNVYKAYKWIVDNLLLCQVGIQTEEPLTHIMQWLSSCHGTSMYHISLTVGWWADGPHNWW